MKIVTNGHNRGMQFFRDGQRNEPGWQTWPTFPGFGNMGYRYGATITHGTNGGGEYLTPMVPVVEVAPQEATEGPLALPPPVTGSPEMQTHPYDEGNGNGRDLLPLDTGTRNGEAPPAPDPETSIEDENGAPLPGDETTIGPEEMGMVPEEKPQRWPIYLAVGAGVLVVGGIAAAFIWGGK